MSEQQLDMYPGDLGGELPNEKKWSANMREMVDVAAARFLRSGMDAAEASRWAQELVLALGQHFDGRTFYLPRGEALTIALRDMAIYRTANRDNIEALATQHRLTPSQIYRIIRQQHRLHIQRVQRSLNLPDPE